MRGRVLDDPPPAEAVEGEGVGRRGAPHAPTLRDRRAAGRAAADRRRGRDGRDGHRRGGLLRGPPPPGPRAAHEPVDGRHRRARRRVPRADRAAPSRRSRCGFPAPDARFGVISDIDDTILETGVQRVGRMIRQTLTGSALTRTPFPGAPELYRDLAAGRESRLLRLVEPVEPACVPDGVPAAPGLPAGAGAAARPARHLRRPRAEDGRIREVLDLHPQLPFVLIGDSGEQDPEIYADIVRDPPRADPRGLHPRGAARPGGRSRREGVRSVVTGRAVRARGRQRRRTSAREWARPALSRRRSEARSIDPLDLYVECETVADPVT